MSDNKIYGPDIYKRNEHGLLENADYIFNEDGSIDWRAMIKPEFLYPNKGWFDARNKPTPKTAEGLADKQLLIMLGGIKELAKLRGYYGLDFEVKNVSEGYVTAKCQISWIQNYESANEYNSEYNDVANATLANTDAFCAKFLETIACNRAFVRCVRNYLNIHIVGADEIDKSRGADNAASVEYDGGGDSGSMAITPSGTLKKALKEKHDIDSFDGFKELLRALWKEEAYRNEEAAEWSNYSDIPAKECRKLIAVIKKS